MNRERSANSVGIPIRAFLFTLPQIAEMLAVTEASLKKGYLYFEDLNVGPSPKHKMIARNITPEGPSREWRVAERELIRWLKYCGFVVIDRNYVRN